jgi:hypothetical protein
MSALPSFFGWLAGFQIVKMPWKPDTMATA